VHRDALRISGTERASWSFCSEMRRFYDAREPLGFRLSLSLSLSLSLYLSIYLSLSLSIYLSICVARSQPSRSADH